MITTETVTKYRQTESFSYNLNQYGYDKDYISRRIGQGI
jgi:hypothetical protein